jgi:hypothetical protein
MSFQTLNHEILKELAVEEFRSLQSSGVIQFSFDDLRNHLNPCLYGNFMKDVCCPNSLNALRLIHYICHTVVGNSIENSGNPLSRNVVGRFIDNYRSLIVVPMKKESVIVDTLQRQDFFLTPLETFIRFPNNEIGRYNERFVSELFT